ncbi:UNVERIFIED_CONTAM: hypothetical protein GTU68_059399 [Idotea baltica]|nr:hypothetical protein [Idotea baltica]
MIIICCLLLVIM